MAPVKSKKNDSAVVSPVVQEPSVLDLQIALHRAPGSDAVGDELAYLTETDAVATDAVATDAVATDAVATDAVATDAVATDAVATDPRKIQLRELDLEINALQKKGVEAFMAGDGDESQRLGAALSALRSKRVDLSLDLKIEGTIDECRDALSVVQWPEGRFNLLIEIEAGQMRNVQRLAVASGPATIAKVTAASSEHKQSQTTRASFKAQVSDPRHPPAGWSRQWRAKGILYQVVSLGGGTYRLIDQVNGVVVEGSGNALAKDAAGTPVGIYFTWKLGNPGESWPAPSCDGWTAPAA